MRGRHFFANKGRERLLKVFSARVPMIRLACICTSGDLPKTRIRNPNDTHRMNRWMGSEYRLDLVRNHLKATSKQRGICAPVKGIKAISVAKGQVRGADPVRTDPRGNHFKHTQFIIFELQAGLRIQYAHRKSREGASNTEALSITELRPQCGCHRTHWATKFGCTVGQMDMNPITLLESLMKLGTQRGCAGSHRLKRCQIRLRDISIE